MTEQELDNAIAQIMFEYRTGEINMKQAMTKLKQLFELYASKNKKD